MQNKELHKFYTPKLEGWSDKGVLNCRNMSYDVLHMCVYVHVRVWVGGWVWIRF
jgi:hypothetical protein